MKAHMKKQTALFVLCSIFLFNMANGQTFKEQFNALDSSKDSTEQKQLLGKWEKSDPNDPELYVAYFNHYVNSSMKQNIRIDGSPKGEDVFKVMSKDTSQKEPVAFIYNDTYYDAVHLKKGFDYIEKGIKKYPDRLDMRFGKIYILGQTGDYENFTIEIIETLNRAASNKNKWTWTDGKPKGNPKEFMLGSVQSYQMQLYNTEDDSLLDNMKRIAETVLKHYPDHVESLSNLSVVYMIQKQYDKALEYLLKAEKINPTDHIVLNNIAQAYIRKGDKINAIKYYELVIKHGDENAKKKAQVQIDGLNK